MAALRGVGVLVTRPEQQALPLCRLLEASGAATLRLPAIDIKPVGGDELERRMSVWDEFGLIVFTSANAVRYGVPMLARLRGSTLGGGMLAAIGPATARALGQAGHHVLATPADGYDSESLLRLPALSSLSGRRVLIVKGAGGRTLLHEELARRGAQVESADVYERAPAQHGAAVLDGLTAKFAAGDIHVITATSAEVAASLLVTATPALRREFERVHWLVPGARVAAALREGGVIAPIVQAASAEDQDLVDALVRWRASVSGA